MNKKQARSDKRADLNQLELDPFSGHVFVFRNRPGTALKILMYDGQGFWLCQERLSSCRLRWWPCPGVIIRVKGHPPFHATIYELQKYRCNLCGLVLTANLPDGKNDMKYDEMASAMLALLRYGGGFPHYR